MLEVRHWYERALVNQSLKRLRKLLARRRQVLVVDHPFRRGSTGRRRRGQRQA